MDGVERQVRPNEASGERGLRFARLAELMVHLTECSPAVAVSAIANAAGDQQITNENALDILARAISSMRSGIDLRENLDLRQEVATTLRPVT